MNRTLLLTLLEGKRLFRDSTKLQEAGYPGAAMFSDATKAKKSKGFLHSAGHALGELGKHLHGGLDSGAKYLGSALKHPWTKGGIKAAGVAVPAFMYGAHHAGKAAEAAAWKYGVPAVAGAGALGYMAGNNRESGNLLQRCRNLLESMRKHKNDK